jgi:hypothetical protein
MWLGMSVTEIERSVVGADSQKENISSLDECVTLPSSSMADVPSSTSQTEVRCSPEESAANNIDLSHCVAVFDRHQDAELAVTELQAAGFEMSKLSIVGRELDPEKHGLCFYNAGNRVKYWGKQGAFWGTVLGFVFAPAFFWIPGIGPIVIGGIVGSVLMGALEGAAVGAAIGGGTSALAGALACLGLPKDCIIRYETDVRGNKFLLIASGDASDMDKAHAILMRYGGFVTVHAST